MRVLYGIQACGNGHITRSRVLVTELISRGMEVDCVFSGRDPDKYFGLETFPSHTIYQGLTIHTNKGKVDSVATVLRNDIWRFVVDVRKMMLVMSNYDVVLCDYEPITAYAAYFTNTKVIGISNQYSNIPYEIQWTDIHSFVTKFIMNYFAPVSIRIGLHWEKVKFQQQNVTVPPILPTFVDADINRTQILVYMPFADGTMLIDMLRQLPSTFTFVVYGCTDFIVKENIIFRSPSVNQFDIDLVSSVGVICNAGFELLSRAIALDKGILTCPIAGQIEQKMNITQLPVRLSVIGVDAIQPYHISQWLDIMKSHTPIPSPQYNTATTIADWIMSGDIYNITNQMEDDLWKQINTAPYSYPTCI